jgi:hypothetical protein
MPSVSPQLAGPPGALTAQVPRREPVGRLQVPTQQSASVEQASPLWMQNEDPWHLPPLHRPEQQSPFAPQVLPSVAQVVFSALHVPPVHCWLQQSPFTEQPAPSAAHDG